MAWTYSNERANEVEWDGTLVVKRLKAVKRDIDNIITTTTISGTSLYLSGKLGVQVSGPTKLIESAGNIATTSNNAWIGKENASALQINSSGGARIGIVGSSNVFVSMDSNNNE